MGNGRERGIGDQNILTVYGAKHFVNIFSFFHFLNFQTIK